VVLSCGLAVVLSGGRRIEVHPDFDTNTFERLANWGRMQTVVEIIAIRKPFAFLATFMVSTSLDLNFCVYRWALPAVSLSLNGKSPVVGL
jgi:hypothetical protein